MIYGRKKKQIDESGLLEMNEVTFAITPDQARELAVFFDKVATELEDLQKPNWHRHIDSKLSKQIEGEVIVMPRR